MVLRYVLLLTLLVPLMSTSGAIETFVNDHDHYAHQDAHIILRYFRSRGRAESIRLILEYLQVPYEEIRTPVLQTVRTRHGPLRRRQGSKVACFHLGNSLPCHFVQMVTRHLMIVSTWFNPIQSCDFWIAGMEHMEQRTRSGWLT